MAQLAQSPPPAIVLADVLDALGTTLLDVAVAPNGLDVPVNQPLIFDENVDIEPDDILLAVGVDPANSHALDLIETGRQAKVSAVVLKVDDTIPDALHQAATVAGVAILSVPKATSWGQLLTLLRTARGVRPKLDRAAETELRIGDLFGLANAIASTVGGATTIEDLESNVLAYSNLGHPVDQPRQDTILGRHVPAGWARSLAERGVFRELYRTDDVVHIDDLPNPADARDVELRPRLAIVVRAAGEALGSIWVQEGDEPLTAAAEQALRAAAQIAAVHLLQHRVGADVERNRRAERLRLLLEGTPSGHGAAYFLPDGPMAVLALRPDLGPEEEAAGVLAHLVGQVSVQLEAFRRHAYAVGLDEVVYVLLSAPDATEPAKALKIGEALRSRTERSSGRRLSAGIGATVNAPRDLHLSRTNADQVLDVLAGQRKAIGHFEDLRGAIALRRLEHVMSGDPTLRGGKLERLVRHDAEHGTSHVETLRAYLDNFGDVIKASDDLHIHRNTFRYRLKRLLEIAQLDLDDPGERLITHLQLRLGDRARRDPDPVRTSGQGDRPTPIPADEGTLDSPGR